MQSSETFIEKLAKIFFYTIREPDKARIAVASELGESRPKGRIPHFLYRLPLALRSSRRMRPVARGGIEFGSSRVMRLSELRLLEFLLARKTSSRDGVLFARVPYRLLIEAVGEDFSPFLTDLSEFRFYLSTPQGERANFSIIDSYLLDDEKEEVHIVFSLPMAVAMLSDYQVDYLRYEKVLDLIETEERETGMGKRRIVKNVATTPLLRFFAASLIPLPRGLKKTTWTQMGFDCSPGAWAEFSSPMIYTREVYSELRNLGIIIEKLSPNTLLHDPDAFVPPLSPERSPEELLEILERAGKGKRKKKEQQKPKGAKKETPQGKKKYVDFSKLVFGQEFAEEAERLGVAAADMRRIFDEFIEVYNEAKNKYVSAKRVWSGFLRRKGYVGKDVKNRGRAQNIDADIRMIEIAKKAGLDSEQFGEVFRKFRNYYTGQGAVKEDWYPMWENWVLNEVSRKKAISGDAVMRRVETNFYLATLVSADIEQFIIKAGLSPEAVARGEVELKEVECRTYNTPPRFGKGKTTVFSWRDPVMQHKALEKYLVKMELADEKNTGKIVPKGVINAE
jgi:hypothetical protein